MGDFLDVHTALGGGHEHDASRGAIDHCTQIQLLGDIGAGFDQNLADRLPIGIGLVGHQTLVQPLLGKGLGLFLVTNQLDAARLATTAGMNLGFYHPGSAADLVTGFGCLFRSINCIAFGDRQSILGKQLLTLIFVKIHVSIPL
ncbi:hypothetical protein D3C81_1812770 [compost metagenome]